VFDSISEDIFILPINNGQLHLDRRDNPKRTQNTIHIDNSQTMHHLTYLLDLRTVTELPTAKPCKVCQ
jgi:hypothetical protein